MSAVLAKRSVVIDYEESVVRSKALFAESVFVLLKVSRLPNRSCCCLLIQPFNSFPVDHLLAQFIVEDGHLKMKIMLMTS